MKKPVVEVYARKDCDLCGFAARCTMCADVTAVIERVVSEIPFEFKLVDIDSSPDLTRRFRNEIPTVYINGSKAFKFKVDETEFRKRMRLETIKARSSTINGKKDQHYT